MKVKQAFLKYSGRVGHFKKSIRCDYIWYGGKHAGFYTHPDLLNENSIVYSFGIGEDISFDRVIIKNHNSQVFAFDPTPKSINWLKKQKLPSNFRFFEYGISHKSGFVEFYLPKNPDHVSGSVVVQNNIDKREKVTVQMKSISDIIMELGHTHIDVLKMDIEGSEYEVIEDVLKSGISINQILVEFHDRFVDNGASKSKQVVEKLQKKGFEIFAVSDNFEEISFINKNVIIG